MGKRDILLALFVSCFLAEVLSQLTPREPRVGCPSGYASPSTWFLNYASSAQWGSLCPAYSKCSTGLGQSPISIPAPPAAPLPGSGRQPTALRLSTSTVPVNLIRFNEYLVMPIPSGTTLNWKGLNYTLNSIEFHSPSEHVINGRYANLEVQAYFSYTDRRGTFTAAIAILYNCGGACDNAFFAQIIPALPSRWKCQCGNNRTEPYNPYGAEQCDEGSAVNNQNLPNHCRANCQFPRCGDKIVDTTWNGANQEQCDAGNTVILPGQCRPNCRLPYCGDGFVDVGEVCDSGSWWEGSGCTGTCKLECGDGCLQPGEQCDYGLPNPQMSNATNATYSNTCRLNCLWARCGDGILDQTSGEQCDQGNYSFVNSTGSPSGTQTFVPNGCRPNCTLPKCGDGVIDNLFGEICEPASPLWGSLKCNGTTCLPFCGDGILQASNNETCDNATLNSNGAWTGPNASRPCRPWNASNRAFACMPATCGDNVIDWNEDCEPGISPIGLCFPNCTFRCGNRYIDSGEGCDNGNATKFPARVNDGNSNIRPNACRIDCQPAACGDGVVDPVNCEQCDSGSVALAASRWGLTGLFNVNTSNSNTRPNACRLNCQFPKCGDGVVDNGEQCDDGNNADDDGCSCCMWDCGNGVKQGKEDCDDGAANSNTLPDRCRSSVGAQTCIRHFCGDKVADSDEECDDGPLGSDYCSPKCTRTFCGDNSLQKSLGEECDNGPLNSYTALGGCSPVCSLNQCGQSVSAATVNLNTLLSNIQNSSAYVGSLTRPPCTEGVQWFVVPQVRLLSNAQCTGFRNIIPLGNNRCAQAREGRLPTADQIQPTRTIGNVPNDRRAFAVCGNGVVEQGEQCDNGAFYNDDTVADACRSNCAANRCGDGVRDSGEECDGEPFCKACRIDRRIQRAQMPADALWSNANQAIWDKWGTCSGNMQSPIRLPPACPAARALNLNSPSNVQYNPTPIVLFNTGSNILFPQLAGGAFSYQGTTYNLYKVEFHNPSEHYIGNTRFPLEVQLFHMSTTPGSNQQAVLSVLFQVGQTCNKVLQPILDRLPPVSGCQCGNGIKEDIFPYPNGTWRKEECDDGPRNNDHLPNRCRSNCLMAHCGDGVVDGKEYCDDGPWNAARPNRCRPNCALPFCGDLIVDDMWGETCDDGGNVNGDGCSSTCTKECGDGVKSQLEQCDLGIYNSNTACDGCRRDCTLHRCGDAVIDSTEQCDDGTANSNTKPNACRTSCLLPTCGDGVVDAPAEQCDGTPGCSSTCTLLCGNGVTDNTPGYNETCDNGAANSNTVPNACRLNCQSPSCGDKVRDDGEACDQGANNIYCQGCQVICGNGLLDVGEECDNGIYNSDSVPNACRTNCRLWACGDGVLDALEECDAGAKNANASDACRPWCRIPECGDGIVDKAAGETCDDGNTADGDGCNCGCQVECGNGRIDPGEVCDAGSLNANAPGCCRTNCQLPKCGDGILDAGEQCDDGAANDLYAPNTCRPDCTLPYCGDGIVDHLFGELCDQGSRNSLTSIDGCSPACTLNLCRQSVYLNTTVNVGGFLPTAPGTYMYQGSLNSPPCTESANWFVFATPSPICDCQLTQFTNVMKNNARCLQARNGRPVQYLEVNAKCGDGLVEGNEQCDSGPMNSDYAPNACRRNCLLPRCGDGVMDKGEQCDGTPNCSQTCTFNCPGLANATGSSGSQAINVNFANILADYTP